MKSVYSLFAYLVALLLITSCDADHATPTMGNETGTFSLVLTPGEVQSEVITRAALNLDVEDFQITLAEANGTLLLDKRLLGELTEAECTLPAATGYQLKAESCTTDESVTLNEGWGMAHFWASTTFDIVSNQHTPVSLACTMDNVGLQVVFDQSFLDKFPIHAATSQDIRSIVFNQSTQGQTAYFSVEETTLNMKLRLTGSAGGWEDRLDVMKELTLSKGKIYTVNITYSDTQVRGISMRVSEVH